jgi:hypothetical protein
MSDERGPGREQRRRFAFLLGLGLDGRDGHYRQTKGENFLLVGGSEKTHSVLQDKALSLNEELRRRGKRLEDVEGAEEMRDIAHDAGL